MVMSCYALDSAHSMYSGQLFSVDTDINSRFVAVEEHELNVFKKYRMIFRPQSKYVRNKCTNFLISGMNSLKNVLAVWSSSLT